MISWKHSFKLLNEENEMVKKKKQALDNLLGNGKISQSTYDLFSNEIDEAVAEIERKQKALLEKMSFKIDELGEQIKTLEMLLANFEIQHVTGELDEEVYQRESNILSVGIETARQELDVVKEAFNQLSSGIQIPSVEVVLEQKMESQLTENVEVAQEKLPEPPIEQITVKETDSFQPQQETAQNPEQTQSAEAEAEGEEKQET